MGALAHVMVAAPALVLACLTQEAALAIAKQARNDFRSPMAAQRRHTHRRRVVAEMTCSPGEVTMPRTLSPVLPAVAFSLSVSFALCLCLPPLSALSQEL